MRTTRRPLGIILALAMLLSTLSGCAREEKTDFVREGDTLTLTREGVTATISASTGAVKSLSDGQSVLSFEDICVDAGIDGASMMNQLGYKDMSTLATYELPILYPRMKETPAVSLQEPQVTDTGFQMTRTVGDCSFLYHYTLNAAGLALDVTLSVSSEEDIPVNGVGFILKGLHGFDLEEAVFEFPGSTPAGPLRFSSYNKYRAVCADYSAPAVVISDSSESAAALFVDETEKWTSGCWYDENGLPCVGFLAAAEGYVSADCPMEIGTFYLPITGEDVYGDIGRFWNRLGYAVPDDTTSTQDLCAIYSGHPYGTMDTGFFNHLTLSQYAQDLDTLSAMGFDAVWLLPVFEHTGDNVYEPIDMEVIDQRYGSEEDAALYIRHAHELGMKVLFDFVPHGPRPVYPFAKDHDDWISKDQNGNNQIEWECVSMDYNHPEYAKYLEDLAKHYGSEMELDGARVDCSMGGLPNWSSATGLRASAAGLKAGVNACLALRRGFLAADRDVLMLPENFHPSPAYASCTDVFYDMPLYRCLYDLNQDGVEGAEYVSRLSHFLMAENKASVPGQLKLRFLGNHDTVSWTFDAQRAQTLYGTDRAKALWMVLCWIDGVLYIYQGDENPTPYHLGGQDLTDFFSGIIGAKRDLLPSGTDTEYIDTGTPVMAFYRFGEKPEETRLVLVNLSNDVQTYPLDADEPLYFVGGCESSNGVVTLDPWSGAIFAAGPER